MRYLGPFWHLATPDEAAHPLRGLLRGDGPWMVGDAVTRFLGCRVTDPDLQAQHLPWEQYLDQQGGLNSPRNADA